MKSNPVVPVVSVVACGNEDKSNVGVGSTDCIVAVKSNPVVPVVVSKLVVW